MSYCVFEIISQFQYPHASDTVVMHCGGKTIVILFYDVLSLKFTEADHSLPCGCWFRQGYFLISRQGYFGISGQEVHDMFHLCLFYWHWPPLLDCCPGCSSWEDLSWNKTWFKESTSPLSTILQEFLFVDRDFAVGGIPPMSDCYGCYHLDCDTYPGYMYNNSKWYWGMSHWYSNKMIFSDQGEDDLGTQFFGK